MFTEAQDHGAGLYHKLEPGQKDQLLTFENDFNQSILHLVAVFDYPEVLKLMPNNAAHITGLFSRDINQLTPLDHASPESISVLKHNYKDLLQYALEESVDNHRAELFQDLLEKGWSPIDGEVIRVLDSKITEQEKLVK